MRGAEGLRKLSVADRVATKAAAKDAERALGAADQVAEARALSESLGFESFQAARWKS